MIIMVVIVIVRMGYVVNVSDIFTSDREKHCKRREYKVASVASTSSQPVFDSEYFLILAAGANYSCNDVQEKIFLL